MAKDWSPWQQCLMKSLKLHNEESSRSYLNFYLHLTRISSTILEGVHKNVTHFTGCGHLVEPNPMTLV